MKRIILIGVMGAFLLAGVPRITTGGGFFEVPTVSAKKNDTNKTPAKKCNKGPNVGMAGLFAILAVAFGSPWKIVKDSAKYGSKIGKCAKKPKPKKPVDKK